MTPRNPETMRKAITSIDELIALSIEKVATLRELKRCLLTLELVPDVDKDGVKHTRVREMGGHGAWRTAKDYTLLVELKSGETREFRLDKVDPALWPEGVRAPRTIR